MNPLINKITLTVGIAVISLPSLAQTFEYPTKEINAYDHNGNLVSSQLATDVQYIEVVDSKMHPEKFTVSGNGVTTNFSMIPVLGTSSYMLQSSLLTWSDEEKSSKIKTFYIGETEVTNALWKAVMGTVPSAVKDDSCPVSMVSWEEICQKDGFLDKLNAMLKDQLGDMEFCLPSEWEWEYAANGGPIRATFNYSGSSKVDDVAWHSDNSGNKANPVKTLSPNDLGIFNMTGNVSEWTANVYRDPETGEYVPENRCTRGGSYVNNPIATALYTKFRGNQSAATRNSAIGFRLALKERADHSEIFTITNNGTTAEFAMIPVAGTRSYRLKSTLIKWDEEERCASIKSFSIGETEVTNALWKAVMGSVPSLGNKEDNYPVNYVSWEDICKEDGFLDRLNELMKDQLNGRKFYLPSEWEWEYAAHSGNRNDSFIYSGSNNLDEVAWYNENANSSHEVKNKKPNALGIYDMTGNVSEWCSTVYRDPDTGEYSTEERCTRGASFSNNIDQSGNVYYIRYRAHQPVTTKFSTIGLRLILK